MKTLFTILFTFITLTGVCQRNWEAGTYTTANGEEISAYINDKNWSQNPTFIFVADNPAGSNPQKLDVDHVKGFKLSTSDWFEVHTVIVDKSPYVKSRIEVDSKPILVKEKVFLRVLVKGNLNLLYLKDTDKKEHFYIQKGQATPEELVVNRLVKKVDADLIFYKENVYKDKLKLYMQDCNLVKSQIEKTWYNKKSLQQLFTSYNACSNNGETAYLATEEKISLSAGIAAGAFNTTMAFRGGGDESLENADFSGLGYAVGPTLEITLPRLNKKWSLYNELLWKSYAFEGENTTYVAANNYTRSAYEIGVSGLGLNTMLRYKMKAFKVAPYINLGVANNLALSTTNKKTSQRHFYTDYPAVEERALESFRKYEQALVAGIGAEYRNFRAEIRVERGNGISDYVMLQSAKNMVGLLIAYDLKK